MCSNWTPRIWSDFFPSERIRTCFYLLLMMYVPSGGRTSASVPGWRQGRRIWDTAVNHVQPMGCWEGTFFKLSCWFLLVLPDYVWISAPALQERKPFYIFFRPSLIAAWCLAFGREKQYRYHYVKIIPEIPKNSGVLGIIFCFWTQGMPE